MIISQTYNDNFSCPDSHSQPKDNDFTNWNPTMATLVVQTAPMNQKMIISQTYNDNFSHSNCHKQPGDIRFTNILRLLTTTFLH